MQFYHHPLSLHSQKARLALEEKGLDYWPHSINPLKVRNLEYEFFREHPDARLPVLVHGNRLLRGSLPIVRFIDSFDEPLGKDEIDRGKVQEWLEKADQWKPTLFTMTHVKEKHLQYFSKFKRQVAIARMAENPDLADKYHGKLSDMHMLEETLQNQEAIEDNLQELKNLLDDAEIDLSFTDYLAGSAFSMADAIFIPILGRIELLNVSKEFIDPRRKLAAYWARVKRRPSVKIAVSKYLTRFGRLKILFPSVLNIVMRTLLKKY